MTHADKLKAAGIKRFGSEEAWRAFQSASSNKARRTGKGGFAWLKENDPEKLKEISKNAAQKRHETERIQAEETS